MPNVYTHTHASHIHIRACIYVRYTYICSRNVGAGHAHGKMKIIISLNFNNVGIVGRGVIYRDRILICNVNKVLCRLLDVGPGRWSAEEAQHNRHTHQHPTATVRPLSNAC